MSSCSPNPYGECVRMLRKREQLTARELGERISYAASHILNVEAGRERGGPAFHDAMCACFHGDVATLTSCRREQLESHAQVGLRQPKAPFRKPRLDADLRPLQGELHAIWEVTSPVGPPDRVERVYLQVDDGANFHMVKQPEVERQSGDAMHPEPWTATCEIDATHRVKGSYECVDRRRPRVDGQFYLDVLPGGRLMWGTWTGLTEEHRHAVGLIVFARDLAEGLEAMEALREQHPFLPFIFNPSPPPARLGES